MFNKVNDRIQVVVNNLLKEQQTKSQALINMWDQCRDQKKNLLEQLNQTQDALEALGDLTPRDANEAAEFVDKCISLFTTDRLTDHREVMRTLHEDSLQVTLCLCDLTGL